MKQYFIRYPRNFGNEYSLCWAEQGSKEAAEAIKNDYCRITRKEAIEKCTSERWARKHDQAFSGFGDAIIYPYGFDGREDEARERLTTFDGYIYK